jgi:poly(3-hydroxybutyrate) depolymerase
MRRFPASDPNVIRLFLVLLVALAGPVSAADPLPALEGRLDEITVSGISSGAYMAGQFHVAFSDSVRGAAIVAGGPYGCAGGSIAFALQRCMQTALGVPDPARLVAAARTAAGAGTIDPLDGLAGDRVYVFSGTNDHTVLPAVAATVPAFYAEAGVPAARLTFVDTVPAGHAFVTDGHGNPCAETGPPFVNDCGVDQAGSLLATLLGPLAPPSTSPQGRLLAFDQREFLTDPTAHGLDTTGFVYVPDACAAGPGCRIHVAFHGCRQTASLVGDAFTAGAGYNAHADTNRVIVLYPQTHATGLNPNACWDWWGYDDPAYATRDGRQMAAVRGMLDRLAGSTEPAPFCAPVSATNFTHWRAGRARTCNWWFLCAVGSGERLGLPFATTILNEHPPGNFGTEACSD